MRTLFFVYLALFILLASSCQKNSGSEATVSAINPNANGYNQQGFSQYPGAQVNNYGGGNGYNGGYGGRNGYGGGYNTPFNYYNNNAYLCNCGSGMVPTYNGASLGCMQSTYLNTGVFGYAYLRWGGSAWGSLPQLYQYNYGSSGSRCYNGAVQSCTVGANPQTCPAGNVCRPSSSGSSIGLCVTSYR